MHERYNHLRAVHGTQPLEVRVELACPFSGGATMFLSWRERHAEPSAKAKHLLRDVVCLDRIALGCLGCLHRFGGSFGALISTVSPLATNRR
jgi:hypothetical protein